MNGWAKCAGSLSILAGLVYFIAIVLAVSDNVTLGDDALAVFISNDTFEKLALVAGGILAVGGVFAIAAGTECKYSAAPALGAMQVVAGIVIVVTALKDVTNISAEAVEVSYLISFLLIAAALVVLGVQKRVFSISVASLILAYCVFDLYVLGTYEGMISVLVGVVIVVFSGAAQLIPAKTVETAEAVEAPAPVAEAEIVRAPVSAPVAANAPLARPEPVKEEAKPAEKAKPAPKAAPAPAAAAKEEAKPAPAAEPAKEVPKAAEPAPAAAAVAAAAVAEEPAKEESKSESDILLEQGWNTAVAKAGENKSEEMDDYEIMATVKEADPELYNKLSTITGIVVADKAAEPAKEEASAVAPAAAVAEEPAKEEPKTATDILLEQGWNTAVANVGEDRAEEMDDYEIMAVLSIVDPKLYNKLSILTGIVVATNEEEPIVEAAPEEDDFDMSELGLEPDTPAGFLRRACWNKGLRCRKDYGPHYIPIAFVKNKVAVYVDGDVPDNRNDEELKSKSWIVLHFKAADITDGAAQAQVIYDAVKENTRALKKKKSKSGKAKKR